MAAELKLTVQEVEGSADREANTSRITIRLTVTTSYGTWNELGTTAGTVTLDGAQIASLAGKKVAKNTTSTLYSATRTVAHGADGTKTVAVAAAFDVNTSVRWIYADQSLELTPIPRASTLTAETLTLGQAGTLHITPVTEGLRHTLRYTFGSSSGLVAELTEETELTWTPPLALAYELPESTGGQGTLTLETYSGETLLGSSECVFTALVPGLYPEVSLCTAVENDGAANGWDVAVKGCSHLRCSVTAQAQYGASVAKVSVRCGTQTLEALSGTIPLPAAGVLTPSVTVTDSRGRVVRKTGEAVTVLDYAPPVLLEGQVFRCDSSGAADDGGSCVSVLVRGEISSLEGRNTMEVRCRYRSVGGQWSGYTALQNGTAAVLSGFAAHSTYEVELSVTDTLGKEKTVVCTVPTEAVSFALAEGGVGAGFGKHPEQAGLDMAWGIWMNGNPITGLPDPAGDSDAVPWGRVNFDRIYPVGSLYLTVSDADPAALFGGTWQQLQDVFLLAAGQTYPLGSTGGEAQHALTVEELPGHSHLSHGVRVTTSENGYVAMRSAGMSDQNPDNSSRTDLTGGDQPHNNLPPYLAVNVWQRTA